jgi:nucleotide-binding universal stress UspA family protein
MDITEHRIVAGYDGSEHARHAVLWAAAEAARRAARLEVLTVVDEDGLGIRGPVGMAHWWTDVAVEGARRTAGQGRELALEAYPELQVETAGLVGLPAAVLIEASRTAELLVVGTRGRNPLAELALGSVAERVAAHAYCPIIVVHRDVAVVPGPQHPIVVGVDGSAEAFAALDVAAAWADAADAELHVVRVWTSGDVLAYAMSVSQGEEFEKHAMELARRTADDAVAHVLEAHPDLRVYGTRVPGVPAQALCEEAAGAGVLVVGSRGLGAFTALVLGSVSHALVRAAPCAVVVVGERVPRSRGESPSAVAAGAR